MVDRTYQSTFPVPCLERKSPKHQRSQACDRQRNYIPILRTNNKKTLVQIRCPPVRADFGQYLICADQLGSVHPDSSAS